MSNLPINNPCNTHSVAVAQDGGCFCTKCGKLYKGNEHEFSGNDVVAWSKWGKLGAGSGGAKQNKMIIKDLDKR